MPANLAKTELVVRPCVALLHSFDERTGESADPEVGLIPRLDAKEVAAVFTAPFRDFLRSVPILETGGVKGEEEGVGGSSHIHSTPRDAEWYQGAWTEWHQSNWRSTFLFRFSTELRCLPSCSCACSVCRFANGH